MITTTWFLPSRVVRVVACAVALSPIAHAAAAQLSRDSSTAWLISAGSEGERYLRTLEVAGVVQPEHWSIRPFSLLEVRRLLPTSAPHAWAAHLAAFPGGQAWMRVIQPELSVVVNSHFPYGMNDGAVWAGRGVTTSGIAGVMLGLGPIEIVMAPHLYRAENWSVGIAPNGMTGPQVFADALSPESIDLPQRFGDRPYQRLDPGQSTVRLRVASLDVGVSTANEAWGPAIESPYLLGSNAAGFPHLFLGTDGPLDVGPLRASVRLIAGRLDQSPYAPASASARRYLTGAVVAIGVRQVPGLEIGASRVFQNAWADTGIRVSDILSQLLKNPFKVRLSTRLGTDGSEPDNQLASVFARWNVPGAGLELYGEIGREDNAYDTRDLLVEPDRDMSFSLGFQRVWNRADRGLVALRGEVLNSAASHLTVIRPQAPLYTHTPVTQGHTQLGQLLGAPGGYGGGAGMVAVEWLTARGRRTIAWRRLVRVPVELTAPRDVINAISIDWLVFRPRIDIAPEATLAYNQNRNSSSDALNFRAAMTGRFHW